MTLAQLLVIQAHDSEIDRLSRLKTELPEHGLIAELDRSLIEINERRSGEVAQRHVLEREQSELEDQVGLVQDRHAQEETRMYSGSVTSVKDLQLIQEELVVLNRRKGDLENEILELMERIDPWNERIEQADSEIDQIMDRRKVAVVALEASTVEIDGQIDEQRQQRAGSAEQISPKLLEQYEAIRADMGGVGAARLINKTCDGCHLQLAAVDYDRIRKEPIETVTLCVCGRILVRD